MDPKYTKKKDLEVDMIEQIRSLVGLHGRLLVPVETLDDHDNLWAVGLASFAVVQLLLALEDRFEVEFATTELATFESIDAIATNVSRLRQAAVWQRYQ